MRQKCHNTTGIWRLLSRKMFVIPISAGSVFWSYFSVMTAGGTFELCNLIKSGGVSPVDIIPLRTEPDPIHDSRLPQREMVGTITAGDICIEVSRSMGRISRSDRVGVTPTSWEQLSGLIISNYDENFAPGNHLYLEKTPGSDKNYYQHLVDAEFKD